jgi:hypothetical protein
MLKIFWYFQPPYALYDTIVGVATRYGVNGPGIESQLGPEFSHLSRRALWTNQPSIQWVECYFRE